MGDARKSYRKSLSLFELVSLGLGGTIGSGIFIVPGIAAGIAGPSSIIVNGLMRPNNGCASIILLLETQGVYPSSYFDILV